MNRTPSRMAVIGVSLFLSACVSDPYGASMSTEGNTPKTGAEYKDIQDRSMSSGVGIESQRNVQVCYEVGPVNRRGQDADHEEPLLEPTQLDDLASRGELLGLSQTA